MKIRKWLAVTPNGAVRITANPPELKRQEVGIRLTLDIPNGLFERPRIEATLRIVDDSLSALPILKAEDEQRITDAVRTATDMDISIRVVAPDPLEALLINGGDNSA